MENGMRKNYDMLDFLVKNHPHHFVSLLHSPDMDDCLLSAGCMLCCGMEQSSLARKALLPFLDHSSSLVREGALYGLSFHMNRTVCKKLLSIQKKEENKELELFISEIVKEFHGQRKSKS